MGKKLKNTLQNKGILLTFLYGLSLKRFRLYVVLWTYKQKNESHGRRLVLPLLENPAVFIILIGLFQSAGILAVPHEVIVVKILFLFRLLDCHILTINQSQGEQDNGRFL